MLSDTPPVLGFTCGCGLWVKFPKAVYDFWSVVEVIVVVRCGCGKQHSVQQGEVHPVEESSWHGQWFEPPR